MTSPSSLRERILLYALLTSLTAFSIDALLPGLRAIGAEFGAPSLSTQYVISLFILGMALGELLLGPLSDAVGRKKALLVGLSVYLVGTVVAMTAGSLEMVIVGRFLQGVGVSGPKIATRAMIRDQFDGDSMARVLSLMFTLLILVPMLAPAMAQGLILFAGWRSVFLAYLVIAGLLGLWLHLRQPETLPMALRVPLRPGLLMKNGRRLLANRHVTSVILATGLVFGAQLLYLATASELFFDAYRIEAEFPLYFAALAAPLGLASFVNARLVQRLGMERMTRFSLVALTLGGCLMAGATVFCGGRLPLAAFMGLAGVCFFAIGILFGNLNAIAMRPVGQLAGLGASLIASGSSLIATGFAVVLGWAYDGTPLNFAVAMFVAGGCSLLLVELALRREVETVEAVR